MEIPKFCSIRETARMGILTEYALRMMERQGKLPCVYSGNKCLVNVNKLIEQLNEVGGNA